MRDAVKHVINRQEPSLVAVNFCRTPFTISELRNVYEAVWNRSIDPGSSQRKVRASNMFLSQPAERIASGPRGGRPASLWSLSDMDTAWDADTGEIAEPEEGSLRKKKTRDKQSPCRCVCCNSFMGFSGNRLPHCLELVIPYFQAFSVRVVLYTFWKSELLAPELLQSVKSRAVVLIKQTP